MTRSAAELGHALAPEPPPQVGLGALYQVSGEHQSKRVVLRGREGGDLVIEGFELGVGIHRLYHTESRTPTQDILSQRS